MKPFRPSFHIVTDLSRIVLYLEKLCSSLIQHHPLHIHYPPTIPVFQPLLLNSYNTWFLSTRSHNCDNCENDKQKPPSCSPSETFEWHRGEKVLKRVDKHDSAEMLERDWLDKCPPDDISKDIIRCNWGSQLTSITPLSSQKLSNSFSTYFLRASSNRFSQ